MQPIKLLVVHGLSEAPVACQEVVETHCNITETEVYIVHLSLHLAVRITYIHFSQHRSSSRRLDFSHDSSNMHNSVSETSEDDEVTHTLMVT